MAETNLKTTVPSKSFMTAGPTLHYSHANVRRCWGLAVVVYVLACLFWSTITGTNFLIQEFFTIPINHGPNLASFVLAPLSIFEYPWQIAVLGLVMGILAGCPLVVSQLLSFRYSIPLILAVIFIAKLPFLGLTILLSCIAVSCRPLRFRSRFIAIVLCMMPQVTFWGIFGNNDSLSPVRWGFSFSPWLCAWLTAALIAGVIIGIGHFTRYRPGLSWIVNAVVLVIAFFIFQSQISFSELNYQVYIADNNPEELKEFRDQQMTNAIDWAMKDATTRSYLEGYFFPADPIHLREALKNEIAESLARDDWPLWFNVPEELGYDLRYQKKRFELIEIYDQFIDQTQSPKRMPTALYYKAILSEYSPDIRIFRQAEILRFYSDYPQSKTRSAWHDLKNEFPDSPESIEARWRIAFHLAGQRRFDEATKLCLDAKEILAEEIEKLQQGLANEERVFVQPVASVMTRRKLQDLKIRLGELELLINGQNCTQDNDSIDRLARFLVLNPNKTGYSAKLDSLLDEVKKDPLRDNILLAQIDLIPDTKLRALMLSELGEDFAGTDGGVQALYELGLLKVEQWKDPAFSETEKKIFLSEARKTLTDFREKYPSSIFCEQSETMLTNLPAVK